MCPLGDKITHFEKGRSIRISVSTYIWTSYVSALQKALFYVCLCATGSKFPKLMLAFSYDFHCSSSTLSFSTLFSPSSKATNLQTKLKQLPPTCHLHPVSKSQRIQLFERFGLPSYTTSVFSLHRKFILH